MIKKTVLVLAVGALAWTGCRSDSGTTTTDQPVARTAEPDPIVHPPAHETPADESAGTTEAPAAGEAVGGGPRGMPREGVIDRLAHARCEAKQRCGEMTPGRDHVGFSECISVATAELRGSFGAATCASYAEDRLDGCARKQSDAACGTESTLPDECVESKLCAQ